MTESVSSPGGDPVRFVDGADCADLKQWITEHPGWEQRLWKQCYIVFRNFAIYDTAAFDVVLDLLMRPSQEFPAETSPRSSVSARLFTSTDYPAEYPIQFHQAM